MEVLQKKALIEAEMATFLAKVDKDLRQPDTMKQIRPCWVRYLKVDSVLNAAVRVA